jgi:Tfp pilus assembly protein PilN
MIEINLLPPAQRPPKISTRKLISVFFLLLLCLFFYYLAGVYQLYTLHKHLADMNTQLQLLRPAQESMLAANDKLYQIKLRKQILMKLTGKRRSWHAIFSHLGATTPPSIRLTAIANNKQTNCTITGRAATYPALADYLEKMDKDLFLAEPRLISADNTSEQHGTSFEIQVKLKEL